MKSYEEVINRLANEAFSNLMGGSMNEWYGIDFDTTAFIFEKTRSRVNKDATKRFEQLRKEYQASRQRGKKVNEDKTKSLLNYLPESFITELGEGPNDSISPVNGGEADSKPDPAGTAYGTRDLKIGDPVAIKNMKYEGKTGTVDSFTDDKHVVVVDIEGIGKKEMHVSDLEYNDYADNDKEDYNRALNNLKTLAGQ